MSFLVKLLKTYPHVHVHADKFALVEETIRVLISDGRKLLHVVADFDFTLTMYEKNGKSLPSTFGVIERSDEIKVKSNLKCDKKNENFINDLVVRW